MVKAATTSTLTASTISHRPSIDSSDPFHEILHPPHETTAERKAREAAEEKAKSVSDVIDQSIRMEKLDRKVAKCVKVLLLVGIGQIKRELGGNNTLTLRHFVLARTLQRQFTLLHAPHTFDAERPSWRLVVFLNVVRSIQRVLSVLSAGLDKDESPSDPVDPTAPLSPSLPSSTPHPKSPAAYVAEMTLRLTPITSLEETIINKLIGPEERSVQLTSSHTKAVVKGSGLYGVLEGSDREFFVRPGSPWKGHGGRGVLERLRKVGKGVTGGGGENASRTSLDGGSSVGVIDWEDKSDPGRIFHSCGPDMIGLWKDPWVRQRLKQMRVRPEENSGFFLDDLHRITARQYLPTDSDILRARIKTVGVSEYIFPQDIQSVEWRLYDVGGARTQRQAWVPYFDSVDSIIFLAPLSPFDTSLPEDRKVNCLEDSLLIWKELCSNKHLAKVPLVVRWSRSLSSTISPHPPAPFSLAVPQ
ncbi:hypothetical protein FRB99_007732 [Tulasnella sp. 403]|nr:hypothetical protein FRB99_007732 [Tulasnella sp. 403]